MSITARTRSVILSSDYSSQEPKVLGQLCNDEAMLTAFREGKDLYCQIAAVAFHTTYENCLEHFPKNTPIKKKGDKWYYATQEEIANNDYDKLADGETDTYSDGKNRRSQAKKILLGLMYGRGERSIAEQLGCTVQEAKALKEDVFNGFPAIKEFEQVSLEMARNKGYVTTLWGRKRRLPEIQLPEYEFYYQNGNRVPDGITRSYLYNLHKIRKFDERKNYIASVAAKDGIIIKSNHSFIAQATRQVLNSRIQGCISGETLIQTKEQGIVPIHTVVNTNVQLWDGNEWTKGFIISSGKKQKCITTFNTGQQFISSPDHKLLVVNTAGNTLWKTVRELSENNQNYRVVVNPNYNPSDKIYKSDRTTSYPQGNNVYIDNIQDRFLVGRILGRLASDGYTSHSGRVMQIVAEHEWNILDELYTGMKLWKCKQIKYQDLRENRTQRIANIIVYSKTLWEEINFLNIRTAIHPKIFEDTEMLKGFISGYFDGDGGISGDKILCSFGKNRNYLPLIYDMQKTLLFFGIRSYVREYSSKYILQIRKADTQIFCQRIGFMNTVKQKKAEQIVALKSDKVFGRALKIQSIEITNDYIDMYDVCNTDRGYFIADGITTHNSAADMSKKAMIKVDNDEALKEIGGKLVIPVHDELIIIVPLRYAREAKQLFAYDMEHAAEDRLKIPIKCDVTVSDRWYGEETDLETELKGLN
jgi:intein/homing endonuclease